jgi:hypothetical protein
MKRNGFTNYFLTFSPQSVFSLHYISHQALFQFSRKIRNTSVKHKSSNGNLNCYMFRFLRNHHQAIHTKYF